MTKFKRNLVDVKRVLREFESEDERQEECEDERQEEPEDER